ncbi:hypothetical protein G9C98_002086 [Cotesia typhae]|uniref:F-box domain-containing protein n=1 Tax=Cotesia typhae TaxID=2053667 RepID=A0A8J5QU23_9HYME|nr:hypothetical protein G9C98_002086 [Cotesia typhae]
MFPNEIWKMILTKITDGKDLIKLRRVNYTFYSLIEPLVLGRRVWENLFSDKMLPWKYRILSMILPKTEDATWKLTLQKSWRKMVLSYKKWRLFTNRNNDVSIRTCQLTKFLGYNENIVCIAVLANTLAIATSEASIYFYELPNLDQPAFDVNNFIAVTQMEFWYADGNLILIAMDESNRLSFWSVSRRKAMTIELSGLNFCVGLNNRFFLKTFSSIKEYSLNSRDNLLVKEGSTTIDFSLEFDGNVEIYQMSSEDKWFQVMISMNQKLKILSYELPLEIFSTVIETQLYNPNDINLRKPKNQLMIMPNSNTAIIVHNQSLTVGIDLLLEGDDKWESHEMSLKDGIHPTSIAMHANMLFIGLSSGYIHVYSIRHIRQLLNKHKILKKLRKIKISDSPVTAIKLTEIRKIPYILASTHKQLYSITL